ncbi:MAG TPA: hypothetical protein PK647_10125 [Deltaproteobacteria bacterium]|nr:hypothetical protein [Deltaproteobacteria bacterium]
MGRGYAGFLGNLPFLDGCTDPGKAPASDPLEGEESWSMPWIPSARWQAVSDSVKAGQ